jgi:acrylyl-CoA reductase (NADPH)
LESGFYTSTCTSTVDLLVLERYDDGQSSHPNNHFIMFMLSTLSRLATASLVVNTRTMSSSTFTAMLVEDAGDRKTKSSIQTLSVDDLPPHDVLVKVAYSTLNYKDGLAITGKGRICRRLPMVGGIDLAGTVVFNASPDDTNTFKEGDRVLVNGFGLGETEWGGYSGYAKLKPEWLVRVPEAFSLEQAMGIGTAGYTSMLCVNAIRDHGISPNDGPILVTGASGGVGSVAIHLLTKLGYQVHASSGRPSTHDYLKSLGATTIIDRKDLDRDCKPMEKEVWAGGVDTVGSKTLASVLAQIKYGGVVAACGLVGGMDLPTSVAPFILRGVALRGIDSVMAPRDKRERAWKDLAELMDINVLNSIYKVEPMSQLPKLAEDIVAGQIQGRVVIDVEQNYPSTQKL